MEEDEKEQRIRLAGAGTGHRDSHRDPGRGWHLVLGQTGSPVFTQEPTRVRTTLHLETFVLNLADTDQRSYLRVGIDLGLNQEAKHGEELAPYRAGARHHSGRAGRGPSQRPDDRGRQNQAERKTCCTPCRNVSPGWASRKFISRSFSSSVDLESLNAKNEERLCQQPPQSQPSQTPGTGEGKRKEELRWQPVLGLPCQLTVDLPVPNFKVADFLALRPGSVLATSWRLAHDVPLRVNGTLIGWAEFEGAGRRLAVRLTELA